jgi:hypothetical protein
MENFYKFLPVFFWLLYKAYKANKKTQQFPKSSPNSDKRKKTTPKLPTFDDILREMMEKKEEDTPKEIYKEIETENFEEELEDPKIELEYLDEQESIFENEHDADSGPPIEEISEDISEIQQIGDEVETRKSSFDLKSAVIADTILNRPEY